MHNAATQTASQVASVPSRVEAAYAAKTASAADLLVQLATTLQDTHEKVTGGRVNWAHVGDVTEIEKRLSELLAFATFAER